MFTVAIVKSKIYVNCPECDHQHKVGTICPIVCYSCSEFMPDGNDLITSTQARSDYHFDSEYFK